MSIYYKTVKIIVIPKNNLAVQNKSFFAYEYWKEF